ncbi:MAG: heme ABC exporter ATP-binding protein CcmA, partial [Acidimicrobiales bacterium]
MTGSGAVVELTDAVALVGGFPALAGATLTLQPNEIVGIRGPNGAGKSTLLRLCAGLVPLRRGEGTVLGCDLATRQGRRVVRRSIGLLGHETSLYDDLSVVENIKFWSGAHRADTADVEAAMDHMGLSGRLATVPVAGLSAGQRRRTAIAVLVARRPRLWLLDEPHAGLDAAGRDLLDQ